MSPPETLKTGLQGFAFVRLLGVYDATTRFIFNKILSA